MSRSNNYVFVIDTRQYSGNFERQLCAHITGVVGECGVGSDYVESVDVLVEEHPDILGIPEAMEWIDLNVAQVRDDSGAYRPCDIWATPGRTNNGNGVHSDVTEENPLKYAAYESVGIFFSQKPPIAVLKFMVERAKTYGRGLTITNFRLLQRKETIVETKVWEN